MEHTRSLDLPCNHAPRSHIGRNRRKDNKEKEQHSLINAMSLHTIQVLAKETYKHWKEDRGSELAAALTYHTLFSLTPLLIVVLAIVGIVYSQSSTQQLFDQLRSALGNEAATLIQQMLTGKSLASKSGPAFLIGMFLTLIGSIGIFKQLKNALNVIWHITPQKTSWKTILKRHLWLFLLVVATGILLIASLGLNALLAAGKNVLFPNLLASAWLWSLIHQLLSLSILTLLSGILLKTLPDTSIAWKHVWPAATGVSLLFGLEKYLFGLYLAHSSLQSIYGAAGSLVALLVWIFYSAQALLFGAEWVKTQQKAATQPK